MKQTKINIKITSRQIAVSPQVQAQVKNDLEAQGMSLSGEHDNTDDTFELSSEGVLYIDDGRVTVEYNETELTGMAGAKTKVSFTRDNPALVTMMREGTVETVMGRMAL